MNTVKYCMYCGNRMANEANFCEACRGKAFNGLVDVQKGFYVHCNKKIPADAGYCPFCGTRLLMNTSPVLGEPINVTSSSMNPKAYNRGNVGRTIECVAIVACILGVCASLILCGIFLDERLKETAIRIGVGGVLASFLSALFIYGFGALIKTNEEMCASIYEAKEDLEDINAGIDQIIKITDRQRALTSGLVKISREGHKDSQGENE